MHGFSKFCSEILPIIIFFIAYKFGNFFIATAAVMVVTIFGAALNYYLTKQISKFAIFSLVMLIIFGGLTLYANNPTFLKIKVTILNMLMAALLLIGVFFKKPMLKYVLNTEGFSLPDEQWMIISRNFGFFFLTLAVLNEIIWRNFSEQFWVNFKIFGVIGISILFTSWQFRKIFKNS